MFLVFTSLSYFVYCIGLISLERCGVYGEQSEGETGLNSVIDTVSDDRGVGEQRLQ